MRRGIGLLLLVLLAGCASRGVAPERLAAIRTLRVVSLVGDPVTLVSVGLAPFSTETRTLPAAGWGIDDDVAVRLAQIFYGRFEVAPAPVDRAALGEAAPFDGTREALQRLRPVLGGPPADAYLVVARGHAPYGLARHDIAGLGMIKAPGPMFTTRYHLFAVYRLWLLDGSDLAVLGQADAPVTARGLTTPEIGPVREVDAALWPDPAEGPTAGQIERLAAGLKQLIGDSLPLALEPLQLIP